MFTDFYSSDKRNMETKSSSDYTIEKFATKGGHGSVYFGTRKSDGKRVVIKRVHKYPGMVRDVDNSPIEVGMMKRLKDVDGICRMVEWFNYPKDYIVVMDRIENTVDLFEFIGEREGNLTEEEALTILKNVFAIALELDKRNMVHRDLKPENVLVDKTTLATTLIDFDSCTFKRLDDKPFKVFNGTPSYYPPEWFEFSECLPEPMTVWSLGLLLHAMVKCYIPDRDEITCKEPLTFSDVSEKVKVLLERTLAKETRFRYTFAELKAALE